MLKFNTFRAKRYLRSKFVEGKYLLASEATDLELEVLDLLRTVVNSTIGDVAMEDAWKVERLSDTELLIRPGQAWFKGLPFAMRGGKDQLVSGAILSVGTVPVGTVVTDDATGLGKVITFNSGSVTPTNTYRFVISAEEELITDVQDPFLQNVNLTETTAQKIRLNFKLNIVPESLQTQAPLPYRDEGSSSGSVTNFPATGNTAAPNFANQIDITPTAAGNGELIALNVISGAEAIDGRDLELVIRNNPGLGGGNPLPNSPSGQAAFANSRLIDSNGNSYYVNAIFNDTISTQLVIRIDKEPDQPNPEIINTKTFSLVKREVFVTDDANGLPQGKLHWPIATVQWNATTGILHDSNITDLRVSISSQEVFQKVVDSKSAVQLTKGGIVDWDLSSSTVTWSDEFELINPYGSSQTIAAGSAVLVEGGSLLYEMDLVNGGAIERGNLSVSVTSFGATSQLASVDLSLVRKGNIVVDSAGVVAEITGVDNINDTITTSPALTANGAATIYMDSFAPNSAVYNPKNYVLAVRNDNKAYIGKLELEDGESSQIGDGVSQELLALLGVGITESTSAPTYSSNIRGGVNEGFQERLGSLTDAVGDEQEDRSAYLRSNEEVTWTGTQLEFLADIVLEIPNTKSGTTSTHTIQVANSPITIANGESVWVRINRAATSENLTVFKTSVNAIPAQSQADKDVFVLFKRIDFGGAAYLHLPFIKQLFTEGQTSRLGASGSGGGGTVKVKFLDPISTSLPTGSSFLVDGVAAANNDLILFTNLSVNNNRVYKITGVGTSIVFTPQRAFAGQFNPVDGDQVRAQQGNSFADQLAVFNGTNFLLNDTVRYFDGVSANYWEQSSIKSLALTNNTTANIFSVNVTGSENFIISYSVLRGTGKETGQLILTSDGVAVDMAQSFSELANTGVSFNASVSAGNLILAYTTDNSGAAGTIKYFVKRWSNSSGGPGGIPNYSTGGGGDTPAAGNISDVQYKGSDGNLAGDGRFQWDATNGVVALNGLKLGVLSAPIALANNQISPAAVTTYPAATYQHMIMEYSISRGADVRTGRLVIANTGVLVSSNDDFVDTNDLGIVLNTSISAGTVTISYTSTNTGSPATMKYAFRSWI